MKAIGDLPRDIAPARDLWPGIAAAIGADAPGAARPARGIARLGQRLGGWRPSPAWALAAALGCVAVGVWIGRESLPVAAAPAVPASGAAGEPLAQAVSYAPDARFERTRESLLREVGARLARLPPPTRARVEASLETVQRARADIAQALGRAPGNALLQEMLVNCYQDEMRVLTTVREIGT